jgi:hypothetical protein
MNCRLKTKPNSGGCTVKGVDLQPVHALNEGFERGCRCVHAIVTCARTSQGWLSAYALHAHLIPVADQATSIRCAGSVLALRVFPCAVSRSRYAKESKYACYSSIMCHAPVSHAARSPSAAHCAAIWPRREVGGAVVGFVWPSAAWGCTLNQSLILPAHPVYIVTP